MVVFLLVEVVVQTNQCFLQHVMDQITWFLLNGYAFPLDQAVMQHDLWLLEFLVGPGEEHLGKGFSVRQIERAMKACIVTNRMDCFELLLPTTHCTAVRSTICGTDLFDYAAYHGNVTFLHWMNNHRPSWRGHKALVTAARRGHLDVVKYCVEHQLVEHAAWATQCAIVGGFDAIVEYLVETCHLDCCLQCLIGTALVNGRLKLAYWFEQFDARDAVTYSKLRSCQDHDETSRVALAVSLQHAPVITAIATKSSLEELQWLEEHFPTIWGLIHTKLLVQASSRNDMRKLQWLIQRSHPPNGSATFKAAFDVACCGGHVNVVKLLIGHLHATHDALYLDDAVKSGVLELVRFLQQDCGVHRFQQMQTAIDTAACNGHTAVVQWFHPQRQHPYPSKAFCNASRAGDLTMLRLVASQRYDPSVLVDAMHQAFLGGQLAAVELLYAEMQKHAERFDDLKHACWRAIAEQKGFAQLNQQDGFAQMEVLGFLLAQEVRLPPQLDFRGLFQLAIRMHQLRIIQMLHRKGALGFSFAMMEEAIASGTVTIVKYLHEHQLVPCRYLDEMDLACTVGCLPILEYLSQLRSHGWRNESLWKAAELGHWKVVRFLHDHAERRRNYNVIKLLRAAVESGQLTVVRYLLGVADCAPQMKEVLCWSCRHAHWSIVRWLLGHHAREFNEKCYRAALEEVRKVQVGDQTMDKQHIIALIYDQIHHLVQSKDAVME